jgi:hypothetical protein
LGLSLLHLTNGDDGYCTPCSSRSRWSCSGDGCYVSNKKCRGFASCLNDNNNNNNNCVKSAGSCSGTPTKDPCKDAVDTETDNSFVLPNLCALHLEQAACEWDETAETCLTSPRACSSTLFGSQDEWTCKELGCQWNPGKDTCNSGPLPFGSFGCGILLPSVVTLIFVFHYG